MALDLNISPWTIFFIALIVVVSAIIALTVIERRLNKRVFIKRSEEENKLQKKINVLKQAQMKPDSLLLSIDNIAREFFEKKYNVNRNSKYSVLIDYFKKNGDRAAVRFCERMQEALYAGEDIDKLKVGFLLGNLEFLVNGEKVIGDQPVKEKPQAEEKAKKQEEKVIESKMQEVNLNPQEEREAAKIVSYLKEGLERDFSINFLRHKLLEGGFNEIIVNEGIRRVKGGKTVSSEASPEKPREVPYEKEKIDFKSPKKVNDNPYIRGVDNLERVEKKIKDKRRIENDEFALA